MTRMRGASPDPRLPLGFDPISRNWAMVVDLSITGRCSSRLSLRFQKRRLEAEVLGEASATPVH